MLWDLLHFLGNAFALLDGSDAPAERLPAPAAASTNGAAEATTAVSTETVDLALTASRATWIEVRAGSATGAVLYTGTLLSGTTKSFRDATSTRI